MSLESRVVPRDSLSTAEGEAMFQLMGQYYEGVSRTAFEHDLEQKQWVLQVLDGQSGALLGFSTQTLLSAWAGGRQLVALFSGDTIVARDVWGRNPLARCWGRFALSLIDAHPQTDLYWLLVSKGYRTYRFLPVFFHEFYPRYDQCTPGWAREATAALTRARFGRHYDEQANLIREHEGSGALRTGVAEVTPARLDDPHVRFFCQSNPRHAAGDELCCLAPLNRANFTPAAWKVIGQEATLRQEAP